MKNNKKNRMNSKLSFIGTYNRVSQILGILSKEDQRVSSLSLHAVTTVSKLSASSSLMRVSTACTRFAFCCKEYNYSIIIIMARNFLNEYRYKISTVLTITKKIRDLKSLTICNYMNLMILNHNAKFDLGVFIAKQI